MTYQCCICTVEPTNEGLQGIAIREGKMRVFKFICESCISNLKHRTLRTLYPDTDSLATMMHGSDTRRGKSQ